MSAVIFFIAAIGAIAGAIGVITLRNPFYCVLALVGHLLALATLFLLLRAEFVAASQVVVYAGAVMVLYVFVVAYVGDGSVSLARGGSGLRVAASLFVGALFVELCIAMLGSGLKAIDGHGAPYRSGFGSPGAIGQALLTKFLFPFELASLLLLVAAVGAVVLARRRKGLTLGDEDADASRYITVRSLFSGTMAESVGVVHAPKEERGEPPAAPVGARRSGGSGGSGDDERGGW